MPSNSIGKYGQLKVGYYDEVDLFVIPNMKLIFNLSLNHLFSHLCCLEGSF